MERKRAEHVQAHLTKHEFLIQLIDSHNQQVPRQFRRMTSSDQWSEMRSFDKWLVCTAYPPCGRPVVSPPTCEFPFL